MIAVLTPGAAVEGVPDSSGGELAVRRISPAQYRNAISDTFGPDIAVDGQFEPEQRAEGLAAIGSAHATFSPAGMEYNAQLARKIAEQVFDEKRRGSLVPCTPRNAAQPDDVCARQFVEKYGRLLFRRQLEPAQVASRVQFGRMAAERLGGFYDGLQYVLVGMLVSPEFLFISEQANGDKLDAYSQAQRLSFLMWNAAPDDRLLQAAEQGRLGTREGLEREVDRLMASPRFEVGMRSFFTDMLNLEGFATLTKDSQIYPLFTRGVLLSSREQILRDLIFNVQQERDYRDIFSSRETFVNRDLGYLYNIPVRPEEGWARIEMPEGSGRAGILSNAGFLALHSHPGRSSATLRGAAVREALLCQSIPPPPGDVDFTLLQDTANPDLKTARDRLSAHVTMPACKGCHKLMDPIGLPLENFAGDGGWRDRENGKAIDTSGELGGTEFTGAVQLGQVLREQPQAPKCLVNRLFSYATARVAARGERRWLAYLQDDFARKNYQIRSFLRAFVLSPNFYRVDVPIAKPDANTITMRAGQQSGSKS